MFAVCPPGLEFLLAEELKQLGCSPSESQSPEPVGKAETTLPLEDAGGVAFRGFKRDLYRANLHLRTASRVLVRLGEFHASEFWELRKRASKLPWGRFLDGQQPVEVRATCHHSKLYHSDAVAERVRAAISDNLGKPVQAAKVQAEEATVSAQVVVVRLVDDWVTLSVDSSGEPLHRRGYRKETAKAPIRETLAAAFLMACRWDCTSPLLDPFCGSGTIPIEAALLARNMAPGRQRKFAFMNWPGFDGATWKAMLQKADHGVRQISTIIQASDRDAGAIRAAMANAERAGVETAIDFSCRALSAVDPSGVGWVATNPPYGVRVSAGKDLRDLYAQFGHVMRQRCPGWSIGVVSNDKRLLRQIGIDLDLSLQVSNGGIRVFLARGKSPLAG